MKLTTAQQTERKQTGAHLELLAEILVDVPTLHQRKCHDCGKTHWRADSVMPYVLCPECGSQDMRRVKG